MPTFVNFQIVVLINKGPLLIPLTLVKGPYTPPCLFFREGILVNFFFILSRDIKLCRVCEVGALPVVVLPLIFCSFVLIPTKCGKESVGEGETVKKAKTTPDASGKSVSEKSQATLTSKNPCEMDAEPSSHQWIMMSTHPLSAGRPK